MVYRLRSAGERTMSQTDVRLVTLSTYPFELLEDLAEVSFRGQSRGDFAQRKYHGS
jgi:hypothetical protein